MAKRQKTKEQTIRNETLGIFILFLPTGTRTLHVH